jgi:hypothetical protein
MNPFSELDITEPSKLLYQRNLSLILGKGYTTLDGLEDIEKIMTYILTKNSPSTKRTYLSCIITALRDKPKYDESRRKYQVILKNDVQNMEQFSDEKTDTQKKNWVDLSVLQNKLQEKQVKLFKDIKQCDKKKIPLDAGLFNELTAHVICSLYLMTEPRRNKDYNQMYIGIGSDNERNYYDPIKQTFTFNNYKTQKKYMTQVVNIPENLQVVLKMYMKYHSKTNKRFLLFFGEQSLEKDGDIKRVLSEYLQTPIGVSLLRNIFASSVMQGDKQELQQLSQKIEDIATKMGTSPQVLLNQYTKK